jgi:pyridoxamine 5'-phosphate oxidase
MSLSDEQLSDEPAAEKPLAMLERWLEEARASEERAPMAMAFVTVAANARPSARTVTLKRIQDGALVFSSALWTRKAQELSANPHVALLAHWPLLGRQVHITARAEIGERALSQELFDERPLAHRIQALASRQGETIDDLESVRQRHAHLLQVTEADPPCPPDWGAIRVIPQAVEFWTESADRIHERLLFTHGDGDGGGWQRTQLAP